MQIRDRERERERETMRSGASVSSGRPRVPLRKRVTLRHRAPGNDFSVARRVIGNFFGERGREEKETLTRSRTRGKLARFFRRAVVFL